MIKKRVMLLASLLLISCLSGCNGIGFFKGDNVEEHTIAIQDVHKGTEGLVMSFLEDAPPDEVFEDSNSVIGLKLENRGACDIKDGYLSLSFDTQYMTIEYILQSTFGKGFDLKNPSFSLGGKSVSNLEGEEGMVIFSTKTSSLDGREMHSSNIAAVACYNYKTEAAETVCIDSDIYNVKKTVKSCSVEDIDLTGQGAPVAVTRIEPRMITKDDKTIPMFMITIENKDDGLVVDKDKTKKACTADKFK